MANQEVHKLLLKIATNKDKEAFKLVAGFVAAVEAGYMGKELVKLLEDVSNG